MKKKIITIVALLALVVSIGSFNLFSKSNNPKTDNSKTTNSTLVEFSVKSAFADVDSDMIVEDKDAEDGDKTYDYVFITFTNILTDTKKEDVSNPFNGKNYKLDGGELPKGSVITPWDNNGVTIKLPNGSLKNTNSSHSLSISKDLKDKDGQSIKGELNIKLSYSTASENSSTTTNNNKSGSGTTSADSQKNSDKGNETDSKSATDASEKKDPAAADMPAFNVRIITNIPQTTIVAVTLDSPTPENYKVTVAGTALELKKNDKGEKIFANSINKEYGLEDVKKLVKIEKVK